MNGSRKIFIITALGAILLVAAQTLTARLTQWDRDAAQRRADYYFMRAAAAYAMDSIDEAYALLDIASRIAPDDREIAAQLALLQATNSAALGISFDDAPDIYRRMKEYRDAFPEDYFAGEYTAIMARKLRRFADVVQIWQDLDSLYPTRKDPSLNLADALVEYFASNSDSTLLKRAMHTYDRIERGTGKSVELSSHKLRALLLAGDTVAVLGEVKALTDSMPNSIECALFTAQVYHVLDMDSLALTRYDRANAIDPRDGRAYIMQADYYRQKDDSARYDSVVFRALESENIDFEMKLPLLRDYVSNLHTDSTQWPRIEETFTTLDRVNPGEAAMHRIYSAFEATRGDFEAAREQIQYAVALDPLDDDSRTTLINLDLGLKDTVAFYKDVRQSISLLPDNLYYPIMMATVLSSSGRNAEALATLDSISIPQIRNPRAVANLLMTRGDIYSRMGDKDSCINVYRRVVDMDRDNFMAMNNLAYFLAEADTDLSEAAHYARMATLAEPENPTYLDTYAWVNFKQRKYDDARHYIDLTLKYGGHPSMLDPDTLITVDTTGLSDTTAIPDDIDFDDLDDLDDTDLQTNDLSYEVLSHAGDIYFMCGMPERALEFWREALALKPDDPMLQRKVENKTFFYE